MNPVLNAVALAAANNPAAVGGVGAYPGSLAASLSGTAPGSPARNFSQLPQITQPQGPANQQPGFPGLPAALSSQLQGINSFVVTFLLVHYQCISTTTSTSTLWPFFWDNLDKPSPEK